VQVKNKTMKKTFTLSALLLISIFGKAFVPNIHLVPENGPGTPFSTLSACTVDQNQPTYNGGTSERNLANYYDWQSFTAGVTGNLCQVNILFCNTSTLLNGTGTLNIYNGTGISGTMVSTQAVTVNGTSSGTNTPFWQVFTITTPPPVVSGQVYTFQFIPTVGGGLTDPYLIQVNIPNVYPAGTCYSFGSGGCLAFATFVNTLTTGIKSDGPMVNVTIYPNPATDHVSVTLKEELVNTPYSITDQLGRILISGKFNALIADIDISTLSPGIYFLKTSDPSLKALKLVKK
jgi:hypothetical protein